MTKNLDLYLASPRGFCSGVCRAIGIVNQALQEDGKPLYVYHEIVHNKHVVDSLRKKGVIFIESLDEIQDTTRPLIISAHGAAKDIYKEANKLNIKVIDATCPLVKKVHKKIVNLSKEDKNICVIGKAKHPEILGTIGQLNNYNDYKIIATTEDAKNISFKQNKPLGIVTQTTLSISEVSNIIQILQQQFDDIESLNSNDTCYATTHRQNAIIELSKRVEAVIVVGSKNSSNSKQLQKTAIESGVELAYLIDDVTEMPWKALQEISSLGISAGASAPEKLVEEIVDALKERYENLNIHDIIVAKEPKQLKSFTI